jgi:hypothetical protein
MTLYFDHEGTKSTKDTRRRNAVYKPVFFVLFELLWLWFPRELSA